MTIDDVQQRDLESPNQTRFIQLSVTFASQNVDKENRMTIATQKIRIHSTRSTFSDEKLQFLQINGRILRKSISLPQIKLIVTSWMSFYKIRNQILIVGSKPTKNVKRNSEPVNTVFNTRLTIYCLLLGITQIVKQYLSASRQNKTKTIYVILLTLQFD